MDRLLKGVGGTLQIQIYDPTGVAADAGAGNGTADVVDSAGAAISGSPFTAVHGSTGQYSVSIPATLTQLDTFDVTWNLPDGTKRYTEFETVGAFLYTIADIRAADPKLQDAVTFPAAVIVDVRGEVEDLFESKEVTGIAFRPRGRREVIDGTGKTWLELRETRLTKVVSVKISGTALSSGELAELEPYESGRVLRSGSWGIWPAGIRNIEIFYEYGYKAVPKDINRAAVKYARYRHLPSPLEQERVTATFTDMGGARLSIAGRDGPTGLPDVDAVLGRYPSGGFGFA